MESSTFLKGSGYIEPPADL